ncbi:MAG: HU family DNA-binding protein [Balneolaceae bacterium]
MNYKDLIDQLAEKTGLPKAKAKERLEITVSVLSERLSEGVGVSVPGLGTFTTEVKDVRKTYNPHHKKYMMTPPKRLVQFSPSAGLKGKLKFKGESNE